MDFKTDFPAFRADFQKAIEELEKKYELSIKLGNISYDNTGFNAKIAVVKTDSKEDYKKLDFDKYCYAFGFSPEHYRQTFVASGRKFALVGFNPKAPKNGCLIEGEDGSVYRSPSEQVLFAFEKSGLIKEIKI
jgi:hypothetical protein